MSACSEPFWQRGCCFFSPRSAEACWSCRRAFSLKNHHESSRWPLYVCVFSDNPPPYPPPPSSSTPHQHTHTHRGPYYWIIYEPCLCFPSTPRQFHHVVHVWKSMCVLTHTLHWRSLFRALIYSYCFSRNGLLVVETGVKAHRATQRSSPLGKTTLISLASSLASRRHWLFSFAFPLHSQVNADLNVLQTFVCLLSFILMFIIWV